jgi:hypothetical protein
MVSPLGRACLDRSCSLQCLTHSNSSPCIIYSNRSHSSRHKGVCRTSNHLLSPYKVPNIDLRFSRKARLMANPFLSHSHSRLLFLNTHNLLRSNPNRLHSPSFRKQGSLHRSTLNSNHNLSIQGTFRPSSHLLYSRHRSSRYNKYSRCNRCNQYSRCSSHKCHLVSLILASRHIFSNSLLNSSSNNNSWLSSNWFSSNNSSNNNNNNSS